MDRRQIKPNPATHSDKTRQIEPLCVSIPEAARLLGVGRSTVYREIDARRLRTLKAGKRRLVPMESIRSWLGKLPASAA